MRTFTFLSIPGEGSSCNVPQVRLREQGVPVARARHLSSLQVLTYSQVSQLMGSLTWASGLIPLGRLYLRPLQRHFHSLGLTDRFMPPRRSDPLVLANLLRHWQEVRRSVASLRSLDGLQGKGLIRLIPQLLR